MLIDSTSCFCSSALAAPAQTSPNTTTARRSADDPHPMVSSQTRPFDKGAMLHVIQAEVAEFSAGKPSTLLWKASPGGLCASGLAADPASSAARAAHHRPAPQASRLATTAPAPG